MSSPVSSLVKWRKESSASGCASEFPARKKLGPLSDIPEPSELQLNRFCVTQTSGWRVPFCLCSLRVQESSTFPSERWMNKNPDHKSKLEIKTLRFEGRRMYTFCIGGVSGFPWLPLGPKWGLRLKLVAGSSFFFVAPKLVWFQGNLKRVPLLGSEVQEHFIMNCMNCMDENVWSEPFHEVS